MFTYISLMLMCGKRYLLVRRVIIDKEEAASVAELDLHRSRVSSYEWLKGFVNNGSNGLKDRDKSGRPTAVSEKKLVELGTICLNGLP
jgi:transposase